MESKYHVAVIASLEQLRVSYDKDHVHFGLNLATSLVEDRSGVVCGKADLQIWDWTIEEIICWDVALAASLSASVWAFSASALAASAVTSAASATICLS